jgi:Spy/CpxP family protein refolding chaperone
MTRTVWAVVVAVLVGSGAIEVGAVARRHVHGGWWSAQRGTSQGTQGTQGTTTAPPTSSTGQQGGRPGGPPPQGFFGGGGDRGGPPPAPSPYNSSWEWWNDADVRKEIGLRPDQTNRINDFYARRVKDIAPVIEEYQKENAALDKMLAERTVTEAQLSLQLTKFNTLRLTIFQSRYLMLYRISKVLDADQYGKLKAIFDRRAKEMEQHRGRGGAPAPAPSGSGSLL